MEQQQRGRFSAKSSQEVCCAARRWLRRWQQGRLNGSNVAYPTSADSSQSGIKSFRKTTLIWLCDTYKRYGSSQIDRIPRRGQIVFLGSDLNQNSNLHWMSQHRASWTESETALSKLNAWGVWWIERANSYFAWYIDPKNIDKFEVDRIINIIYFSLTLNDRASYITRGWSSQRVISSILTTCSSSCTACWIWPFAW